MSLLTDINIKLYVKNKQNKENDYIKIILNINQESKLKVL